MELNKKEQACINLIKWLLGKNRIPSNSFEHNTFKYDLKSFEFRVRDKWDDLVDLYDFTDANIRSIHLNFNYKSATWRSAYALQAGKVTRPGSGPLSWNSAINMIYEELANIAKEHIRFDGCSITRQVIIERHEQMKQQALTEYAQKEFEELFGLDNV